MRLPCRTDWEKVNTGGQWRLAKMLNSLLVSKRKKKGNAQATVESQYTYLWPVVLWLLYSSLRQPHYCHSVEEVGHDSECATLLWCQCIRKTMHAIYKHVTTSNHEEVNKFARLHPRDDGIRLPNQAIVNTVHLLMSHSFTLVTVLSIIFCV